MKLLTLDFETYYDKGYSLKKITPPEYILSPLFETICVSVQIDDGPIGYVDGPDFDRWLWSHCPPDQFASLCFNALFDNCILAWRYKWVPKLMIDGLGMARYALASKLRSLTLEKVAEHLELGQKGSTIKTVIGMHRQDIINAGLWPAFTAYAMQDTVLCKGIFKKLLPQFPPSEFAVMDAVLRTAVQPKLHVNVGLLEAHIEELKDHKEGLLEAAGITRDQCMSSDQFCQVLESIGVDVEYKLSPTGNYIPALAKTDDFMTSLLESEDPITRAVAEARLGTKSTLEEKRSQRFIAVGKATTAFWGQPLMPLALRFSGAHTTRLSGEWKMNAQNLPAGRDGRPPRLRESIEAPPGHKVVAADLGQIEARLTAWLCRCLALLSAFAKGDPYALLAGEIFSCEVTKAADSEYVVHRFVGKSGILGLGYGLGAGNFYIKTAAAARGLGLDLGAFWTEELAERTVRTYRRVYNEIPAMWGMLEQILKIQWSGKAAPCQLGPVEIGHGYVKGPGGLTMFYEVPETTFERGDMFYLWGGRKFKIYGAKFLENVIQFLARIVLMEAMLRIRQAGLPFALQVHDELVFAVPDLEVDSAKKLIHTEMVRPPSWALDLPLKAEEGYGQNYAEAK